MELRHLRDGTIYILGALAALKVGSLVVSASAIQLVLIATVIFTLGWVIWAGKYWWAPTLIGATVGGTISFGFKIYPLDIALFLSVLALIPLLLLNYNKLFQGHRRPLIFAFYVLAIFIPIRIALDFHSAHGGLGNLTRVFFQIEWPFLFAWLFYYYGRTSVLSAAVIGITVFTALRMIIVSIASLHGSFIYIPGINYIISAGIDTDNDLRGCAYFFMVCLLILSQTTRSFILRSLLYLLSLGGAAFVLQSGSRLEGAFLLVFPVVFFAACRRWMLLVFSFMAGLAIVSIVNFSPGILDKASDGVARSLSGLIIKQESVEISARNLSSNEWHSKLRSEGYRRWTASLQNFVIGDDLKPFRQDSYYLLGQNNEEDFRISASADVSAYESGLWTVLGTLGAVGYVLYLLIFFSLWRHTLPYLWRHKIRTVKDGVIFWGTYSSIVWATAGFLGGTYPSLEIALMVVAVAAIQDLQREEHPVMDSVPRRRPEIAYA